MKSKTLTKPEKNSDIIVDRDLLEKAKTETCREGQVIVHCHFPTPFQESLIRIWRSTYLRDQNSSHKSKLLNAYNITFYPVWKPVKSGKSARFTLVFAPLPQSCTSFDLLEDIPNGDGFFSGLINRNKSDVYHIELDSNLTDPNSNWF